MHLRPFALLSVALLTITAPALATTTMDRSIVLDPGRLRLSDKGAYVQVDLTGGGRETRPGRPDLPWMSERVELPTGQRIVGIEVLRMETRRLAGGAAIAAARVPSPGLVDEPRSTPDPRWYASASAQPEQVVSVGQQGDQRGSSVAYLRVSPVQWHPRSGDLFAVTRLELRLTLDAAPVPPLVRERIVPEWEGTDGLPAAPLAASLAGRAASAPAGLRLSGRATPFRPTQVPSVMGNPVAYVIVTSDAMAPVFQQLADWKTQTGLPAVVRTVSFIRSQYPSAADDAERIRLFLRDAYTRWGTKWVLLGGDVDIIPVRLGVTTFYGGEKIATDLYYQCLDGNWDANGDSLYGQGSIAPLGDAVDLLPELYVGRAPVLTAADAQVFVNKTLQYERTPLGTYEDRWLFFAEVLFPHPWTPGSGITMDGGDLAEEMLPLTDLIPSLHVARLYENYTQPGWRAGVVPETKQAVVDSINAGYGLTLHVGHGYRNVMEVGDGSLLNADVSAFVNGNRLFNQYAINCTSNAIDFPCIGKAFLLNPNGGAVTNIGSTRYDFPSTGQVYQYEFFRLFAEDSVTAVGELHTRQKLPYVAYSDYDGVDRWTQMTLLMLGDPELRMYRGAPRTLAVTCPASIAVSDTQIAVTVLSGGSPVAGARVTAYRAGDDFSTVLTDGSGNATLPFRPDTLGSLSLTVTAFSARPYTATVAIVAAAAPVLASGAVTVVDGGSSGTSGDANGSLDAGETADLRLSLANNGGSASSGVTATLSTTDGMVTILTGSVGYGTVAAGGRASAATPSTGFRISVPYTMPDQREIPFTLQVTDAGGHHWTRNFQIVVHAPELASYSHTETETTGNGNGRPEAGELVNYVISVRNNGSGTAYGVGLVLRSADGLSTVTDSTSTLGDIAPGATVLGDPVQFSPSSASAKLTALFSDAYGVRSSQTLELSYPSQVTSVLAIGQATSVALTWAHSSSADLRGYNVYRSTTSLGPFAKVTVVPTDRISYYTDPGLLPLTRYYYKVTAVDSSGNEGTASAAATTSTNPPVHGIFPITTGRNTPSSVALERIWSANQMAIVAGADKLYAINADGTTPVDADGSSLTIGDFSVRGGYFPAGPSAAVLDRSQGWSIIGGSWDTGATWDTSAVYVFDKLGQLRPGWPVPVQGGTWSSVACGDLDGDGKMELVWGSNSANLYAVHADGSELIDGDLNPSTRGVFKVLGAGSNYGTPALADLDGDGHPEIVYGGYDGNLYAWKADGTLLPGFPYHTSAPITCSVAIGFLDGPGDTVPEIVFANGADSVFVVEPNGQTRPGWGAWARAVGNSRIPSPAIADMNNDGYNEVIFQSTNGLLHEYSGAGLELWPISGVRYSAQTSGASECSPIIADIDGDGFNDVITGDEKGVLNAISGADGHVLPGFPIQLSGEVRGTPAVADIDGDGKTEIVVADWDKNIYVWDYDFPFQPSGTPPWPQFHHDARRTGFSGAPVFVGGVDDGAGAAITALEFAPPSPNPAHGEARLRFAIPAARGGETYELSVYDLNGRRVRLVDSGIARPGRFSLAWDLRDGNRRSVGGGVYFARFTLGSTSLTRKLIVLQ